MALDILIVDDEEDIRELVSGILSDEGFETRTAHDSESALQEVEARRPSLIILDIWLQGSKRDGLEVLRLIKNRHKDLPIIMISGHGNIETAVAAIKLGAYDFIEKPFQTDKMLLLVDRATEAERLRKENEELKKKAGLVLDLTGNSSALVSLKNNIDKVAPTNSRVMIMGPIGAGKEVVARMIHERSSRHTGPFVVVNAANIESSRMEQELFGVEQNGKVVKTGLFEQAHGGTLFMDEISDMPINSQAKILRVLTEQRFTRVGGNKKVQVDIRVLSSSSRDLMDAIEEGRFREDLYHRLNVVPLKVPSLAERRDDIPQLAAKFMETIASANGRANKKFNEEAMAAMQAYDWPGNVRQLKNVIEQVLILSHEDSGNQISAKMLPINVLKGDKHVAPMDEEDSSSPLMASSLREARESFEREYLRIQIRRFSGNISKTASFIGMERSALHRKLKSLGLITTELRDKSN